MKKTNAAVVIDPVEADKMPLDPPFTRAQLKAAIPAHCFERSHLRSFTFLTANLLLVWMCYRSIALFEGSALAWLGWPVYWFVQGVLCTGIWVLAHECGHRAFSPSEAVNDAVGLVLHSALLVPYHSWRISHREHHAYTNHTDMDQVFVPVAASQAAGDLGAFADGFFLRTAFGRLCSIVVTLTLGWPAYLLFNTTGRNYHKPGTNHFNPNSSIFADSERTAVMISDAALLVVISLLSVWAATTSFGHVVCVYGVPYLCVNAWLVLITLLQHTDYAIPHYDSRSWTWVKGALCTVDRDYGLLNHFFHHIGDTHVLHHLFYKIPHYHAQEASRALVPLLGKYYRRDDTPIAQALWTTFKKCACITPASEQLGAFWWLSLDDIRARLSLTTDNKKQK